jgi:high-affinity Fe2+/Pb2+ permease
VVQRIEVRRSAAGKGALIGAGIGLVAGLAAGVGIASSVCDGGLGPCNNAGGGISFLALAGTAGGALLGAGIGAANKEWRTVYRAPDGIRGTSD